MPISIVGKPASNNSVSGQRGFTYLVVLVALIVMGVMAETASQSAYIEIQKDRESQLLFAGYAYYNAIRQFHQTNGYYPRSLKDLLKDPTRMHRVYLRALYPDPMQTPDERVMDSGWRLIRSTDGGIAGVASRSGKEPLKKINFPRGFETFENASAYSEWEFEYSPNTQKIRK